MIDKPYKLTEKDAFRSSLVSIHGKGFKQAQIRKINLKKSRKAQNMKRDPTCTY